MIRRNKPRRDTNYMLNELVKKICYRKVCEKTAKYEYKLNINKVLVIYVDFHADKLTSCAGYMLISPCNFFVQVLFNLYHKFRMSLTFLR